MCSRKSAQPRSNTCERPWLRSAAFGYYRGLGESGLGKEGKGMSAEENKAQFRRAYEEVLNQGDLSVVDELIAPDFFNHEAPPGRDRGPESMRWLATMLRTAFPDLRFIIEALVAEGDIVAGRLTISAVPMKGPLRACLRPDVRCDRTTCTSCATGTARP